MKKFEYITIEIDSEKGFLKHPQYNPDKIEDLLNELGEEGWELATSLPRLSLNPAVDTVLLFKREKSKH